MPLNCSLLLSLWISMDTSSTNIFWDPFISTEASRTALPGEFARAKAYLTARGFGVHPWTPEIVAEAQKSSRVIRVLWLNHRSTPPDQATLASLDQFIHDGGGLLVLLSSQILPENIRAVLSHFQVSLNQDPAPAKNQLITVPFLNGLRLQAPKTRLLDVQENALEQMILLPNDLKQLIQTSEERDRSGLRALLGKRGNGRLAFLTGGESFMDAFASKDQPGRDLTHNNLEVLFRICLWLGAS